MQRHYVRCSVHCSTLHSAPLTSLHSSRCVVLFVTADLLKLKGAGSSAAAAIATVTDAVKDALNTRRSTQPTTNTPTTTTTPTPPSVPAATAAAQQPSMQFDFNENDNAAAAAEDLPAPLPVYTLTSYLMGLVLLCCTTIAPIAYMIYKVQKQISSFVCFVLSTACMELQFASGILCNGSRVSLCSCALLFVLGMLEQNTRWSKSATLFVMRTDSLVQRACRNSARAAATLKCKFSTVTLVEYNYHRLYQNYQRT